MMDACGSMTITANVEFTSCEPKSEFLSVVQSFCGKLRQEMSEEYDWRTKASNDIRTIKSKLELLSTNGHGTILKGSVEFNVRENNESLSLTTKGTFLSAIESFCRELEQEMDGHYDERKEACLGQ